MSPDAGRRTDDAPDADAGLAQARDAPGAGPGGADAPARPAGPPGPGDSAGAAGAAAGAGGPAGAGPAGPARPGGPDQEPTRRPGAAFRRLYGAGPLHLVAMLLAVALALYAMTRILDDPSVVRIALWFVGAALVWDLVLGPALALVDRLLQPLRRVGALNHVRVPLLGSGLLLLVWAPSVLQRSEGVLRSKAGLQQDVFLGRWLLISAVLFGGSAILYALRSRRPRT